MALLEKRRFLNNHSGDFPQVILILSQSRAEHTLSPYQKIREIDTKEVDSQKVSVSVPNPPKLCLGIWLNRVNSWSRLFPAFLCFQYMFRKSLGSNLLYQSSKTMFMNMVNKSQLMESTLSRISLFLIQAQETVGIQPLKYRPRCLALRRLFPSFL